MKKNLRWKKLQKKNNNHTPFYKNLSELETHIEKGRICIIVLLCVCVFCMCVPALIWALSFKYRVSCACVQVSHVQLLAASSIVACQAPLSMEFSRQEYWSVLPCSLPADFPKPRDCTSFLCLLLWQSDSLPPAPPGKLPQVSVSSDFLAEAWRNVVRNCVCPSGGVTPYYRMVSENVWGWSTVDEFWEHQQVQHCRYGINQ